MNRWMYLLGLVTLVIILILMSMFKELWTIPSMLELIIGCIWFIAIIIISWKRVKDIGYSSVLTLGIVLPFINILVFFACLILPTGYNSTKRLDKVAKILIAPYLIGAVSLVLYITMKLEYWK